MHVWATIYPMLKVTSSGCFYCEFIKVLQSEYPPGPLTQTLKDSPKPICSFGNSNSYSWDDIGSALCSSRGFSSPSHSWYVSDLSATVIVTSSPQCRLTPATVTSTLNCYSSADVSL